MYTCCSAEAPRSKISTVLLVHGLDTCMHHVFECPEVQYFSEQWPHLSEGPQTMLAFMWQDALIGENSNLSMLVCIR